MKYNKVIKKIEEEKLIKFTSDIVKIPSVYDEDIEGANESGVTEYVSKFLKKEGFEVHIDQIAEGRSNIIAFLRGNKEGKTILFEGHQDVVSIGDKEDWTHDPFGAEIVEEDGKKIMYGRGVNDTKENMAAAIFAAKAIKDSNVDFKGNILLCIPVDEEGMMIGIKDCIKKGWLDDVDAAVVCEPEDKQLCIYQKGALRIEIKVKGKMAHGSMPLTGVNPNWGMAKIINEIEKLEFAEKNRVGEHEYLGWPSFTPTVVKSPEKGVAQLNVIPNNSFITLDIRTIPGQDHDAIINQIKAIIKRLEEKNSVDYKNFEAEMEVIDNRPWTKTDKEEPVVKAIGKAYRDIENKECIYNGVPGATDGTFIKALKDIPVIVTGAGKRDVPHQIDEWVEVDHIVDISKIYALTALYFLNEEVD